MCLSSVYDIAGSAMHVQSVRLNTVASNLANSQSVAQKEADAYRAKETIVVAQPERVRMPNNTMRNKLNGNLFSVQLAKIIERDMPVEQRYQPDHPYADEKGLVYYSNVDAAIETTNMMAATREFETAVSLATSARRMQDQLLELINV